MGIRNGSNRSASALAAMGSVYEHVNDSILNEYFTSTFRPNYISIKGVTVPARFKDFHKTIESWTVYDDDIWICSFPKTGTTWTQEMVWMIMNDVNFVEGKRSIGERCPFLDHSFLFDYRKLLENNNNIDLPPYFVDSIKYAKDQKRPRFIKTHLPWNLLPMQIQNGTTQAKIIYVTRNPKDTCVSYYHHCKLIESYKGSFDDFCQLFLSGKLSYAPFWTNVLEFWQRREQPNILFLKYEDLKRDLSSVIRQTTTFLERSLTEEQVKCLTEHLSFGNMKNNEAVNYEPFLEQGRRYKLIEQNGCFMRSGRVGSHEREMTTELVEKFDSWIKEYAPKNIFDY